MARNKIADIVSNIVEDFLNENGYMLYDQEYVKEGQDRYLRIYIDKQDGTYVGTEDCEKVSRYLSDALDREDPIEENYILEVSSPGLDRKLTKPEHFAKYIGELVEVGLYKPINGNKHYEGKLLSYDDGNISIEVDGEAVEFTGDMISKVNLAVII